MADEYHCANCDLTEARCECVHYCYLCQGTQDDVRLCEDGYYYCLHCREACDFRAQN